MSSQTKVRTDNAPISQVATLGVAAGTALGGFFAYTTPNAGLNIMLAGVTACVAVTAVHYLTGDSDE